MVTWEICANLVHDWLINFLMTQDHIKPLILLWYYYPVLLATLDYDSI